MSANTATPPTVSHMLGEMTWVLTQSPLHRAMALGDLEWLVMPALLLEQFYIFRDEERPIGLALWASTDRAGENKLTAGMIEPENRLSLEQWNNGERVWLVDLVAPFANAQNKQLEVMMADLISGPLRGRAFSFHQTDPATGQRTRRDVQVDAGDRLRDAIAQAAGVEG
ncbi:toxin-activating lysine-acyltransferase [Sphingomonas sp. CFBP9021]|uniref:toxin-activating lysine-acyltransferase n=1 Tax=Sphingomonas sp. CFBP9021 TaxID=3096534 RepID=UPI002A6A898F|nr:toxin-activating lysine-acyltransferase [Sphingomonas sp. CFBP9021]MDY0969115.1 toxin-activating lysine-acyltransferase [Sphingomonas sp. CFBP9021]